MTGVCESALIFLFFAVRNGYPHVYLYIFPSPRPSVRTTSDANEWISKDRHGDERRELSNRRRWSEKNKCRSGV